MFVNRLEPTMYYPVLLMWFSTEPITQPWGAVQQCQGVMDLILDGKEAMSQFRGIRMFSQLYTFSYRKMAAGWPTIFVNRTPCNREGRGDLYLRLADIEANVKSPERSKPLGQNRLAERCMLRIRLIQNFVFSYLILRIYLIFFRHRTLFTRTDWPFQYAPIRPRSLFVHTLNYRFFTRGRRKINGLLFRERQPSEGVADLSGP